MNNIQLPADKQSYASVFIIQSAAYVVSRHSFALIIVGVFVSHQAVTFVCIISSIIEYRHLVVIFINWLLNTAINNNELVIIRFPTNTIQLFFPSHIYSVSSIYVNPSFNSNNASSIY